MLTCPSAVRKVQILVFRHTLLHVTKQLSGFRQIFQFKIRENPHGTEAFSINMLFGFFRYRGAPML